MKTLIVVLTLLIAGCVTNPPSSEPFQHFLDATNQVAESSDQALVTESARYMAAFENTVKSGNKMELKKLFLSRDEKDAYGAYFESEPVFETINAQRKQLGKLNELVTQYAELLVRMVSDSGAYDAGQQAEALNAAVNKVVGDWAGLQTLGAGGFKPGESGGKTTALLSAAFATAAKAYIENKRREDLVELLERGQPIINEYANQGMLIAKTAAATLTDHYDKQWKTVANTPGNAVNSVLSLNHSYLQQLALLKQLSLTFDALARSHGRLVDATREGTNVSFESLIDRVKTLKALYDKLSKQNAVAVVTN